MLRKLDTKRIIKKSRLPASLLGVLLVIGALYIGSQQTNAQVVPITFPIIGPASFSNDFTSPRDNGAHHATDIFANKHRMVVAAADGTVTFVPYPEPSYGYMIRIQGNDGYTYNYIHLNNDTPGTDNGRGGGMHAYAPDMVRGYPVKKGQFLGYVGDSGNAENTPPHIHFEIYRGNTPINPYDSLKRATRISKPASYPQLPNEFLPYGSNTRAVASMASGNFAGNPSTTEMVYGAEAGGGPHVKVVDANDRTISSFFAYDPKFRGGIDVAAGDIDGDGVDEIITSPGKGGGPHVKVFDVTGKQLTGFFVYDSKNRDGVRVAAGDLTGDGRDNIITIPRQGSRAQVSAFDSNWKRILNFYAYGQFRGGADISAGDVSGDTRAEIVTSAGIGGGPHIKIFNQQGRETAGFFAYNANFRGGVRLDVGNVRSSTPKDEIVTVPETTGGSQIKVFNGDTSLWRHNMFLEDWWRGPYNVVAGPDMVFGSAGGDRRTTVRPGL